MRKLTHEEKRNRSDIHNQKKLDAMPVIGMAIYDPSFGTNTETDIDVKFRLQVVKLYRRRVTMKTINGKGTISCVINDGRHIRDVIQIELAPCNIVPSVIYNGVVTEIPQGSDVPL